MSQTIQYLFIIALVLIVVAYFAGSTQVIGAGFGGATNLFKAATGQGPNGFLAYPTAR